MGAEGVAQEVEYLLETLGTISSSNNNNKKIRAGRVAQVVREV
jgi:hypothetical protein